MRGVEKEHCKISIAKLALGNPLLCHSGLDRVCPVLDTGESRVFKYWFPVFTGTSLIPAGVYPVLDSGQE